MTEVSARRAQTRDKLLDAAIPVIATKGVGGASVEEICDAAGFTRGAFYSNFENKDALCEALMERIAADYTTSSRRAIDAVGLAASSSTECLPLEDFIRRGAEFFLASQGHETEKNLATMELRLHAVRNDDFRPRYMTLMTRVIAEFCTLIEDAASGFGFEITVPTEQLVRTLQAVYDAGALENAMADSPTRNSERVDQLVIVLRSMIAPISA